MGALFDRKTDCQLYHGEHQVQEKRGTEIFSGRFGVMKGCSLFMSIYKLSFWNYCFSMISGRVVRPRGVITCRK